MTSTRGIVAYDVENDSQDPIFKMEDLEVDEPGDYELLVEMVATGLCHSDITVALRPGDGTPRVLGHEGAGRVLRVGSKVTKVGIKDPVLLSYHGCGNCRSCLSGHPAHCLDAISARGFQPRLKNKKTGQAVKGLFFGQSSFTHIALVREVSVVPATPLLKDPSSNDELKLFAPMCCGFMTGAGTVINTARPTAETDTLIMGLGGVGMGALMAAKIAGCKTIMAVDRIESRLRLAMELGATATLNTDGCKDLATELETFVKKSTADGYGTGLVIDTTVYMPLIYAALGTLRNGGQIILLGVPRPTDELQIPLSTLFRGALTVRSEFMGDTLPEDFIPRIVEWYRKGQFPIEKMVKYFKAEDMADAVAAMRNGTAIKPILVW